MTRHYLAQAKVVDENGTVYSVAFDMKIGSGQAPDEVIREALAANGFKGDRVISLGYKEQAQ